VQQVGLEEFNAAAGQVALDRKNAKKSPDIFCASAQGTIVQGLLGFLKTGATSSGRHLGRKVTSAQKFKLREGQDLAGAPLKIGRGTGVR
jgi:hypothetical protein